MAVASGGALVASGETIDRVAAVVGRQMITWSEVQREARLEAYFNGQPPPGRLEDQSPEYRELLERLIQQRLIQHEMDQSRFPQAYEAESTEWLKKLRPTGVDPTDYDLREQDLMEYGKRLARTDRFLELRFARSVSLPGPRGGSTQEPAPEEEHEIEHWLRDLRGRLRVRVMEREAR